MASELRSWFLRNVLEATERQLGVPAVASLRARLPPRLSPHASLDRLRASAALDAVPLDEGEELLLAIDSLLGDGSGKLLESIGLDLATRVLSQSSSGVARAGDLYGTVARLQAFLEHPFVGVPLVFEMRRNPAGFSVTVGVGGHLRATRALRHLTIGAIIAAERFAREAGADNLKIYAENVADRSNISARYLAGEGIAIEEAVPTSRRPLTVRPPGPSLSEEVERILSSTSSAPPRRASDPGQPVIRVPDSSRTRPSLSAPPRATAISQPELEEVSPPESFHRIRSASSSRIPAIKKPGSTDRG